MTHQNLKPHLHALKNRHGTPNFWHRADDFKAQHSQFSTCKRVGPKCNVAPVPKILGVPRLPPEIVLARVNEAPCQKIRSCKSSPVPFRGLPGRFKTLFSITHAWLPQKWRQKRHVVRAPLRKTEE